MGRDERHSQENGHLDEGESDAARLERLGRERPQKLGTMWKELGFVFSIVFSQCLNEYWISGVTVLVPELTEPLGIPPARVTWPVAAFSLVVSGFLLPFGRLADIYGGKWVYVIGIVWTSVWGLVVGFSQNEIMLDVCRAIQGLGPVRNLQERKVCLSGVERLVQPSTSCTALSSGRSAEILQAPPPTSLRTQLNVSVLIFDRQCIFHRDFSYWVARIAQDLERTSSLQSTAQWQRSASSWECSLLASLANTLHGAGTSSLERLCPQSQA